MKKIPMIALLCAIVFSMQNVSAQQSQEVLPLDPIEVVEVQDNYQPLKVDRLSEIIKAAVEKDFPGASIAEAYTDKIGNYKLVLAMGNDSKTVYTNARGEWFDPEK
ncbi:hypothetical protein [Aquimarina sp. AU119]|uniref:hypothetical protein n=1 Tax=Aquimarina sp. AU119 TaxID=2108528 RepID=UPI00135945DA|nr:hypothetical protein [Aquimarina sp. AU119]